MDGIGATSIAAGMGTRDDNRPPSPSPPPAPHRPTEPPACWHCCHHFQGPPIPMPLKYDAQRRVFHVTGTFCSWACMKRYALFEGRERVDPTVLTAFLCSCIKAHNAAHPDRAPAVELRGTRPAPPRLALASFGGHMTLQEFRAHAGPAPPFRFPPHGASVAVCQPNIHVGAKRPRARHHAAPDDATAEDEPVVRLRRPTPLPRHNMLVRTMGLGAVVSARARST